MTSATAVMDRVSAEQGRDELAKFFTIADLTDTKPGMFSAFIDAEWHQMMDNDPAGYAEFCQTAVGHPVGHAPINGAGPIAWLDVYHERFGVLTPAWFADKHGVVDASAYDRYLDTREVSACWNCSPDTGGGGDGDYAPASIPANHN